MYQRRRAELSSSRCLFSLFVEDKHEDDDEDD